MMPLASLNHGGTEKKSSVTLCLRGEIFGLTLKRETIEFLLCRERPVDGVKSPLAIRLDQHRRDDEGPFGAYPAHPVAQAVDPEMGGICQPIIQ